MSRTDTLKHYGETLVGSSRTGLLAAIGAGDVAVDAAVERARFVVDTFRSRAEALPGEAQVQADLAVKEARTRAEQTRARAASATAEARVRAAHAAATVRPETVLGTVTTLVGTARTQALGTLAELADRGERVVEELYRQPVVRRVAGRTEQTVDVVAETVEDTLVETGETVGKASDRVTSVAQKTKARAGKAVEEAEQSTEAAAKTAKRRVRTTGGPAKQATRKPVVSDTTPVPDPTAIPAKSAPSTDIPS